MRSRNYINNLLTFLARAISLYLGRMPALTELPSEPNPELSKSYTDSHD